MVCCVQVESLWEHTTYLEDKENRKDIPIMPPDLGLWLTLISSNYPCLEHIHGSKEVRAIEVLLFISEDISGLLGLFLKGKPIRKQNSIRLN